MGYQPVRELGLEKSRRPDDCYLLTASYIQTLAEDLRAGYELPSVTKILPGLADLALEAWPE